MRKGESSIIANPLQDAKLISKHSKKQIVQPILMDTGQREFIEYKNRKKKEDSQFGGTFD